MRSSGKQAIVGLAISGAEIGVVKVVRRTIGADDFALVAHIKEDMGVIEGRHGADAHEFLAADGDLLDAGGVVKMRNDVVGHGVLDLQLDILAKTGGTITPARQDE